MLAAGGEGEQYFVPVAVDGKAQTQPFPLFNLNLGDELMRSSSLLTCLLEARRQRA